MVALIGLLLSAAWAGPAEDKRDAELLRIRKDVANQVQLSVFDLVDEMVVGWKRDPIFSDTTPVVVAGVSVPVGLGTGLQAMVENHLAGVLLKNPDTHIQLAHCPQCTALVVHSGPEGTVVTRGFDDPAVLEQLGETTGRHALFIDVEAEGSSLVLRARITRLNADLPIVWSHTLAASTSTPSLLRSSTDLKTADEAREEYLRILQERSRVRVPIRLGLRTYARPANGNIGTAPPPVLWLQAGAEVGLTEARAWTASAALGYSFIPQAYQGMMVEGRMSRLLSGRAHSLTHPDLYAFLGVSAISMWGPGAGSFQVDPPNLDELLFVALGQGPRYTFGTIEVGLDLRLGNRIGFGAYLETIPSLRRSQNLGEYVRILGTNWQSLGTELTVCF